MSSINKAFWTESKALPMYELPDISPLWEGMYALLESALFSTLGTLLKAYWHSTYLGHPYYITFILLYLKKNQNYWFTPFSNYTLVFLQLSFSRATSPGPRYELTVVQYSCMGCAILWFLYRPPLPAKKQFWHISKLKHLRQR